VRYITTTITQLFKIKSICKKITLIHEFFEDRSKIAWKLTTLLKKLNFFDFLRRVLRRNFAASVARTRFSSSRSSQHSIVKNFDQTRACSTTLNETSWMILDKWVIYVIVDAWYNAIHLDHLYRDHSTWWWAVAKNHFLVVGGVKMRPKKVRGPKNGKTKSLLQGTVVIKHVITLSFPLRKKKTKISHAYVL
jgi:hypothetical protein